MAGPPTYAQMERLIEFMEDNPQIAKGQVRDTMGRYETKLKWEILARELNSMGLAKNTKQWSRIWANKKYNLKRRLMAQRFASAYCQRNGLNDEPPLLSALDNRILLLVWGKKCDHFKKKKEPDVQCNVEPVEQPKPRTMDNASQTMDVSLFQRSPRNMIRNLRSQVNLERQRLINIEERRVKAEAAQAIGWHKAAKAFNYVAKAVLQCGQTIAEALNNRDHYE